MMANDARHSCNALETARSTPDRSPKALLTNSAADMARSRPQTTSDPGSGDPGSVAPPQPLQGHLQVVDEGYDNLAILRHVALPDQHRIAVQDPRVHHRVTRHLQC